MNKLYHYIPYLTDWSDYATLPVKSELGQWIRLIKVSTIQDEYLQS